MESISKNRIKRILKRIVVGLFFTWLFFGVFIGSTRMRKTLYDYPGIWESKNPPVTIIIPEYGNNRTDVKAKIITDERQIDAFVKYSGGVCWLYSYDENGKLKECILKTKFRMDGKRIILEIYEDNVFGNAYKNITLDKIAE